MHTETLQVVDGQRLTGAPPGVIVLTPPLHPAPARQDNTLFIVLGLGENAPSRLYREVREAAAKTFWSTPGSVAAALRRAVIAVNHTLFQHNRRLPPEQRCLGAISCAAAQTHELFLAQAGPACACLLSGQALERYPQDILPPLGTGAYVEIRLAYLPVRPADRLLLASQDLASLSDEALQRTLSLSEMATVLDGLEQVAAAETFSALIVHWPAPEPATAAPSPPPLRRKRRPAPPPIRMAAPDLTRPDIEKSLLYDQPSPPLEPVSRPAPLERAEMEEKDTGRFWETLEPEEEVELPQWQPRPQPPTRVQRPARPSVLQRLQLGVRLRQAGQWAVAAVVAIGGGLSAVARRALPGRGQPARSRRMRQHRPPPPENSRALAGVAVGILVLIAVITILAWFSYGSAIRRQKTLDQAREYVTYAQQATDPAEERTHWQAVLATTAGIAAEPEAAQLRDQAQLALDRLDGVVRVQAQPLWSLEGAAAARRLIAHGPSLFVLDPGRQAVLQLTLSAAADAVADVDSSLLSAGEKMEGQTVGRLIDMAWNQRSGDWATDALVVLDAENRLWVCDPAWTESTAPIYLGPAAGEGAPMAMAAFEGRLYLLDPRANQIWRYRPRGGGYPDRAEPYFPTTASQSLAVARDLAINGNVYVLSEDGRVTKYYEGEAAPFEITGVPGSAPYFVALATDARLTDGPLYLADGADERVIVVDSRGNFQRQLRAAPGAFDKLQAVALDDTGSRLFVLAGGRLYAVSLASLP